MSTGTVLKPSKVICLDRAGTEADWIGIYKGRIVAVGTGDPPDVGEVVHREGVALPGMIDAHYHLTNTGIYRLGLDLRDCRSVVELLEALTKYLSRSPGSWIVGGNFDPGRSIDGRMPTGAELDRLAKDRVLMVSRTDGHSCVLNLRAWEAVNLEPGTPGIEFDAEGRPTGILSGAANYEARRRYFSNLPYGEIRKAQIAGCEAALERGITTIHEMGGASSNDFDVLMQWMPEYPLNIRPYLATSDIGRILEAGLECIGGDWFLDGSIGSRTAAFGDPYHDGGGTGTLYHDDEEVTNFFVEASRAGLQAGVHAIGDSAISQAIRCMEEAFIRLGPEGAVGARALRHRIEHFECCTVEQIERAVGMGMVASVQPAFDRYWGGPDGMYAKRLGPRAAGMNPFSEMVRRGMTVAGGSDSPVTPPNPWLGVASAAGHHRAQFALGVEEALRLFTIWAAAAGKQERERGSLEVGKWADVCIVPRDPRDLPPEEIERLEVIETWVDGEVMFRSAQG